MFRAITYSARPHRVPSALRLPITRDLPLSVSPSYCASKPCNSAISTYPRFSLHSNFHEDSILGTPQSPKPCEKAPIFRSIPYHAPLQSAPASSTKPAQPFRLPALSQQPPGRSRLASFLLCIHFFNVHLSLHRDYAVALHYSMLHELPVFPAHCMYKETAHQRIN